MKISRKELKQAAKTTLRESAPKAMLVTLVYLLLTTVLTTVVQLFSTNPIALYEQYILAGYSPDIAVSYAFSGNTVGIAMFVSILVTLFTMVMSFGYSAWALRRGRGEPAGYGTLITGFSMAGRVIGLNLFVALFAFLWAMAVMIPAAILIAVAAALLLGGSAGYVTPAASGVFGLLAVVIYVVAIALLVMVLLRYAMANYALLDDPQAGIRAAVNRSKALMAGHKGGYFMLHLSFIGWYLLMLLLILAAVGVSLLALGAGFSVNSLAAAVASPVYLVLGIVLTMLLELWLVPYIQLTDAGFYLKVSAPAPVGEPAFPEL